MSNSDSAYLAEPRETVSQGDLFGEVTFARVVATGEVCTFSTDRYPAMLLSHDCEYDKPRVEFVLMARVRPLAHLAESSRGNVRTGGTISTFYLPPRDPRLPEAFVDFEHVVPVSKAEVSRLATAAHRIASLSDEGRL